jgi:hypothetical protein
MRSRLRVIGGLRLLRDAAAYLLKYIHTVRPSKTMVMIQREESFIPVFLDMPRILSPLANWGKS